MNSTYESHEISSAMDLLMELISELGLSESAKTVLSSLDESIRTIVVNKASDLADRTKSKHTGITNPGCICYLISVMQQFFMIPGFRQGILNVAISLLFIISRLIGLVSLLSEFAVKEMKSIPL